MSKKMCSLVRSDSVDSIFFFQTRKYCGTWIWGILDTEEIATALAWTRWKEMNTEEIQ